MINFTGTYTDQYQLTMAQSYFLQGQQEHLAVFDYFFRKNPFEGGYALFAGLETLLDILVKLRFNEEDLAFLKHQGFDQRFLTYLKQFRFQGTIHACREGELVFPNCPILRIEASLIEAQLIETILLNILNFQTLIATKASRMREVAGRRSLIDFGLRRAQGPGGYYASRAAIVGGFDATSNVCAGRDFAIPVSGTMAHAFVQSYEDELTAFRHFAEIWPENCVLLVDTYDSLNSGIPNAIQVGKELQAKGYHLKAIRLDSGDLAYLSKKARQMLDKAGLKEVKIAASNQLDEDVIKSLLEQQAPIDIFGVGTSLVVGRPDAALDGVYKLALSNEKPCIKLSENLIKTTLPYKKQVYRLLEQDGTFWGADVIVIEGEEKIEQMLHPFEESKSLGIHHFQKEPLLDKVMEGGQVLAKAKTLEEIAAYGQKRLALLPSEYKRFDNPHIYKVGLSEQLKTTRNQLIRLYRHF